MSKQISISGIKMDSTKKISEGSIKINRATGVCGYGKVVTNNVAKSFIKAFHDEYIKGKKDTNMVAGVTFGKEALLSILAQNNCEGIRFYFGKRTTAQWDASYSGEKYDGLTLVAIGVDANNVDLGSGLGNAKDEKAMTLATVETESSTDTIIIEVVPPIPS